MCPTYFNLEHTLLFLSSLTSQMKVKSFKSAHPEGLDKEFMCTIIFYYRVLLKFASKIFLYKTKLFIRDENFAVNIKKLKAFQNILFYHFYVNLHNSPKKIEAHLHSRVVILKKGTFDFFTLCDIK